MAHIYQRKTLLCIIHVKQSKNNFSLVKCDLNIENKFPVSLKHGIVCIKHDLRKVLCEFNTPHALYEGPLPKGMCVRNLNVMGFDCPTSSFNDPLLQIANHIHASFWEPRDVYSCDRRIRVFHWRPFSYFCAGCVNV